MDIEPAKLFSNSPRQAGLTQGRLIAVNGGEIEVVLIFGGVAREISGAAAHIRRGDVRKKDRTQAGPKGAQSHSACSFWFAQCVETAKLLYMPNLYFFLLNLKRVPFP